MRDELRPHTAPDSRRHDLELRYFRPADVIAWAAFMRAPIARSFVEMTEPDPERRAHWEVTMQISGAIPQLRTTDLAESVRFYTTKVGLTSAIRPSPPGERGSSRSRTIRAIPCTSARGASMAA